MELKFNNLIPELCVSDFRKSLDFYTEVLGFRIGYERNDEGFAFLIMGRSQIMIDQIEKGKSWMVDDGKYPLGNGINLQIEVKSIKPLINRLKAKAIKLYLEVEEKWYRVGDHEEGNRQFIVQDPDGYMLRFTEDMGKRPI